jgi:hypothetical protein
MLPSSNMFTLFGGFRRNPFPSSGISVGVNPFQYQWNPTQVYYSSHKMSLGGNPFIGLNHPMQGSFPSQGMSTVENPTLSYRNQMRGGFPPYNQFHNGFTQKPILSVISSWKSGASNNTGYYFLESTQLKSSNSTSWNYGPMSMLIFLEMLNLSYLSKLINDIVFHDPVSLWAAPIFLRIF